MEKTRLLVQRPRAARAAGRAGARARQGVHLGPHRERNLDVLEEERERQLDRPSPARSLARTDTGRAAGLAASVIAGNVIALAFTVVFARVLGASDYGSLAALLSAFIILMVPGSALQIAVARDVSTRGRVRRRERGRRGPPLARAAPARDGWWSRCSRSRCATCSPRS